MQESNYHGFTYCMSDIHGEYDRYISMLEYINFSSEDRLFIIGDAIDRHPNGVDILMDIMKRPNVYFVAGNHEEMLLNTLGPKSVFGARQLWQSNGGSPTRRELLYHRTREELQEILKFVASLPDHLDIEVDGRAFHLVHGMPSKFHDERLWDRPTADTCDPIPGVTVIVGHTPTLYLNGDDLLDNKPFRIWHGKGIIDIDCGCGNQTNLRRLACLRLDDMSEFYI